MIAAIIPARNEAENLPKIYKCISTLPFDKIITVVNGCTDNTLDVIAKQKPLNHFMIYFNKPLGVDVPRAVGAWKAYAMGCKKFCFIDGDMIGDIRPALLNIITALHSGTDLALTNCYPIISRRSPLTNSVLQFRGKLNRLLGYYNSLGLACPSHGPHGISARLLRLTPASDLAIPPTMLVHAEKHNLKVDVASAIAHQELGSPARDASHAVKMGHTIIGDCLEAISLVKGEKRSRIFQDFKFDGYNSERRFDLLKEYSEVMISQTW